MERSISTVNDTRDLDVPVPATSVKRLGLYGTWLYVAPSFPGMLRRAYAIAFTYGRDVQQRGYSNQCLSKTSALSFFDLSNGKGHRLAIRVVVIRISINVSQPITDF